MNKPTPVVLSVAGSDPMAGAGLQADIKTAAAMGAYCCTVVSAVTAQNSRGVSAVWPVSAEQLEMQFRAVLQDLSPAAIKIGMLADTALAVRLAELLDEYPGIPVVIDPVWKASADGACLGGGSSCVTRLLAKATLVTPNLSEAAQLLGLPEASDIEGMKAQARALLQSGAANVLLKGGHLPHGEATDVLGLQSGECHLFRQPRCKAVNTHGTGCTLATAIAVGLAQGRTLSSAVTQAKSYIQNAIAQADSLALVPNNGPLQHFFS